MDHVYLVCYDICDPKRWRRIYNTMKGYGVWLQLSIFQCRLNRQNLLCMTDSLTELMHCDEDHVLIIDIGPAESIAIKVESLGRPFKPIERRAIIV
ncbi:MAG: CRISPR-associated endonuclease Cas2 [Desulfobulbaceae bacterium]|nr:CRISPR-associated endonuclease Cas2 [Desulfobulbaceae bacterium]